MEGTLRSHLPVSAPERIVVIGAGNVATHLGMALGRRVVQVWSRTVGHAQRLAALIGGQCGVALSLGDIVDDAALYVVAVSDDAIAGVARQMRGRHGLWVHTSGSTPADVLEGVGDAHGVLYPLQTFSREARLDMSRVPIFVEATTSEAVATLRATAALFTTHIHEADSARRRRLHIAAVYACNFANYMWLKADQLLAAEGLGLREFAPMIEATLEKAMTIGPWAGQTGPARRGDRTVVAAHEAMLPESDRQLYMQLSDAIFNHFNQPTHRDEQD